MAANIEIPTIDSKRNSAFSVKYIANVTANQKSSDIPYHLPNCSVLRCLLGRVADHTPRASDVISIPPNQGNNPSGVTCARLSITNNNPHIVL